MKSSELVPDEEETDEDRDMDDEEETEEDMEDEEAGGERLDEIASCIQQSAATSSAAG
jgi:hypothetical protein